MRKMKSFFFPSEFAFWTVWTESWSATAHVDVYNNVYTNYPDKCAVSVLHNVEGFPGVEGNSWLLDAEDLKMFSSSAKHMWSCFLHVRSWFLPRKTCRNTPGAYFEVFGGGAGPLLQLALLLSLSCWDDVKMSQESRPGFCLTHVLIPR